LTVRASSEGYAQVPGGRVWFKIVGTQAEGTPLLTLHGGPGAGHDYLEPLEALAAERPVVFFDQLGCGKSDKPEDVSLWHIDRFVREVEAVREELSLDRVHLFGQSWGGWLAIEYMLGKPSGVDSLTLASTSASCLQYAAETARLRATLLEAVLEVLRRYEAVGDYHAPEYEEAALSFYREFFCRLDPFPEPVMRSFANLNGNPVVYRTMQGPNEFTCIGNLKDWDRTSRLAEIAVPTLVTCGRFDLTTPSCAETLHRGIRGSELAVFENSAHMAHLEESDRYLQVLSDFLGRVQ
jgi:proline-specific peptidase